MRRLVLRVRPWLAAALSLGTLPLSLSAATSSPRLAVVIAIDQCRADYLERFEPYFGEGGFRRMQADGAWFREAHYRHATTKTAVGHATIMSGVHSDAHGIVANDWLDRSRWVMMNAVEDPDSPLVGAPAQASPLFEARAGRSPRNYFATSVGDQLKLRLGANARVFGVANKDRSAILMGGKLANGAFWLGDANRFITSTYYRPDRTLPGWVEEFNTTHPLDAYFGQTWDRLIDASAYEKTQGPDDAEGEFFGLGLGRTFPRKLDGGRPEISDRYFDAFDNSPHALTIVAQFAEELIRREQLGADDVPDILCIGFSQIDTVGHSYGPDSHEVMDSMLRLDRLIAGLLTFLDEKVGADRYVVAVTADHGVAPLPERVLAAGGGVPAGRVDMSELDRAVTEALDAAFGTAPEGLPWSSRDNSGYHLRPAALEAKGVAAAEAAKVVKSALLRVPHVTAAFTAEEILTAPTEGDSLPAMLRRSYRPGVSQDVLFTLAPYFIDKRGTGSTHGSHYAYDTHVPLLWFGAGVPRLTSLERVGVDDIAPTLSGLLGIPAPPEAHGRRLF